jgi:SWI/SNF-related matrix-associated actin-dependent regulator of chromatin subfamily A3
MRVSIIKAFDTILVNPQAHIIREPTKSFAMSACALQATRRWCVTGTPIQNRLLDLYSLFKFLKCAPFDDVRVFKAHISRDGRRLLEASSVGKLKTLVNCLSLRRPKSTVDLPLRNDATRRLDFSPSERRHYELVKASATQCISEASEKAHRKAFLNALHRVNELRLICNHGIKNKNMIGTVDNTDIRDSAWTAEAAQTLFDEMETAGIALCSNPHCAQDLSSRMSSETDMKRMEEPRLGESANLFCSTCFEGLVNQSCTFYTICNHLPRCSSTKTYENAPTVSSIFDQVPGELPTKIEAVVKDLGDLAEGTKR